MGKRWECGGSMSVNFTEDEFLTIIDWFNGYLSRYYNNEFDKMPECQQAVINKVLAAYFKAIDGQVEEVAK